MSLSHHSSENARITIRPSLRNVAFRWPGLAGLLGAAPTLGFAVVGFSRASHHAAWVMVAALAVVVGLLLAAWAVGEILVARNMMITIGPDTLERTDLWGRKRVFPLSSLARVDLTSRPLRGNTSAQQPITRFLMADGTSLFDIPGREFSRDDLLLLCEAANVALVGSWPSR